MFILERFGDAKLRPLGWCVKRCSGSTLSKAEHLYWAVEGLILPVFHESLLLAPDFFPCKRGNIFALSLRIPDWNIQILWELVNRNLRKERVKKVGSLFHRLLFNWDSVGCLKVTERKV